MAQVGIKFAAGPGHGTRAPQAFQFGQRFSGLAVVPGVQDGHVGKLAEDLEAALLRFDQVQPLLLVRVVGFARCKGGGAQRAFLPGEFLALHEVEQRHQ